MKKLALCFSLLGLYACGDSGSNHETALAPPTENLTALENTEETRSLVASQSNYSCEDIYLVGNWSVVDAYSFDSQDVIEISEDCLFETYHCGTLGYITDGGDNPFRGIIKVTIMGHVFPKPGECLGNGAYTCSYVEDGMGELRISCQGGSNDLR